MVTKTRDSLQTRDLIGVEILSPGTWNGRPYSSQELDGAVEAFRELGPDGSGQVRPPGKLGHDKGQKLAQVDGYPAIGWVSRLYRQGAKLLADFEKVPGKVAELIQAGAYNAVSSELYLDLSLNDKVYPFVLKAVSFLGADMPAVKDIKSISDVAALFTEADFPGQVVYHAEYQTSEIDPDNDGDDDRTDDPEKNPDWQDDKAKGIRGHDEESDTEMAEGDMDALLAAHDAHVKALESMIAGKPGAKRIRTYLGTARRDLAAMKKPFLANKEKDMDTKKIATLIGLPETATEEEIEARLAENSAQVSSLSEKVDANHKALADLMETQRTDKANADVESAIKDGRLLPAQREPMRKVALSDPEGFQAIVKATPRMAFLSGPVGQDGTGTEPIDLEADPTPTQALIDSQLGVTTEMKKNAQKSVKELMDEHARKVAV